MVRNNTKGRRTRCLDYECYEPMAIKLMAEIGRDIAGRFEIDRIAMVHRLGRLLIGETSVSIIVTAPSSEGRVRRGARSHQPAETRGSNLEKKHFEDGEVWVVGEWDEHATVAQRA